MAQCPELDYVITNQTSEAELNMMRHDMMPKRVELQIDELSITEEGTIDMLSMVVYLNEDRSRRLMWSSVGTKNSSFQDETVLRIVQDPESCKACIGACD